MYCMLVAGAPRTRTPVDEKQQQVAGCDRSGLASQTQAHRTSTMACSMQPLPMCSHQRRTERCHRDVTYVSSSARPSKGAPSREVRTQGVLPRGLPAAWSTPACPMHSDYTNTTPAARHGHRRNPPGSGCMIGRPSIHVRLSSSKDNIAETELERHNNSSQPPQAGVKRGQPRLRR